MTAAGVQTIDAAAYLPSPPASSTPDAKGTSTAGKPATDAPASNAQGASDFQSELDLQQAGPRQAGEKETGSAGLTKAGSGKPGKKRNSRQENNPIVVTPVPVAQPQTQTLPLALTLAPPQEHAKLDQNPKPDEKTSPDEIAQGRAQQAAQVLSPSLAAVAQLPELPQPVALKPSAKVRQSAPSPQAPPNPNPVPGAVSDPGNTPVPPFAPVPAAAQDIPVRQDGKKSDAPYSPDQAVTLVKPGASPDSQPAAPAELDLPAVPPDPAATPVPKTADSAPSSPSRLAFAARMPAPALKTDQADGANAAPIPAVPGSQTPAQIPVRYAPTAQIIQSAALGTKEEGSKKDPGAALVDPSARADARAPIRTDMVAPRIETASQPSPSSATAPPQQPAPSARMERVIEPPATPTASSHDIRVRVPDSSGGSTQVRFVESGGEVRVSVRTADEGLAQNLRTHLNDLTQRLSDGGMPAEIWKPASNAASSQNDQHQPGQDGRGQGGQGSGGQGGQQDRQQKRPAWLEEMEASLHGEQH